MDDELVPDSSAGYHVLRGGSELAPAPTAESDPSGAEPRPCLSTSISVLYGGPVVTRRNRKCIYRINDSFRYKRNAK